MVDLETFNDDDLDSVRTMLTDHRDATDSAVAQRILAEAIARELGPRGVHVAYVVIDAVIDLPWTRERWPERPDPFFIKPSSIAEEIWHIVHQARDAWSFNVELRPFGETW